MAESGIPRNTEASMYNAWFRKYMGKPQEKSCEECAYCIRWKLLAGKMPCGNPEVKAIHKDLPCFVRRGSKEAHDRGLR